MPPAPGRGRPRLLRALAAAALVIVSVGACAGGGAPSTSAAPGTTAAGSGFPVQVQHKYGTTEIPAAPRRVVTVGLSDQDAVLALGITPVGVTDWFGDYPNGVWPWQQDGFGDTPPTLVGDASTINFEAIAALRPDLILGVYSGVTQEQYTILTGIAPTVAQPVGFEDYSAPWQDMTMLIGQALGQPDQAAALVADIEARFQQTAQANPEFAGRTVATAAFEAPGSYGVYPAGDPKNRFLTELGFVLPDPIRQVTADGYGTISAERFDLLNVDLLVWFTSTSPELIPELEASPVYQQLAVRREGRDVFLDADDRVLNGAISWSTVLSLPIAIDEMVPRLPAALDGDPATTP